MKLINRVQTGKRAVYDIEVEEVHEFYANKVLVHNCATNGGVSVIKDNGTVVDISQPTSYTLAYEVAFTKDNKVAYIMDSANSSRTMRVDSIPASDFVVTSSQLVQGSGEEFYGMSDFGSGLNLFLSKDNNSYIRDVVVANDNNRIIGCDNNIAIVAPNLANPSKGSVAYITSDYNTGYMVGDIKLATLSDTDTTDVVGSELITNGTFDSDTGWTKGAGWTISGGTANQDGSNTANSFLQQDVAVVAGKDYIVSVDVAAVAGSSFGITFQTGTAVVASKGSFTNSTSTVKTISRGFTCTSSGDMVLIVNAPAGITSGSLDNITFKIAEEDRSVNGNGLQVFGTVTKTPVATGADLVGYSGFSSSSYLVQPYNSDLDFGTSDFSIMGWINVGTSVSPYASILSRVLSNNSETNAWSLRINSSDNNYYLYTNNTSVFTSPLTRSTWQFLTVARRSGVVYFYVNGAFRTTGPMANTITNVGASVVVGYESTHHIGNSSVALWRVSATAPTAKQIAKIYNDEKPLFQENAQATLYGTSDAVTALAYDDDTELLHAGTSSGRSVFQGLRRVSNTTDAITTSISASNSIIVEE